MSAELGAKRRGLRPIVALKKEVEIIREKQRGISKDGCLVLKG